VVGSNPLSDEASLVVAGVAVVGLAITVAKFIQSFPVRILARAKLIDQLESQAPVFMLLRSMFGFKQDRANVRKVSDAALVLPEEVTHWERGQQVKRLSILIPILAVIPIGLLAGIPWYGLSIGAVMITPILVIPEYILYRRFTAELGKKNPSMKPDRRWIHDILGNHYSVTMGLLALLYVAGLSPILQSLLPSVTPPSTLTFDQTAFVALVLVLFAFMFGWLVLSEYLDSRERMYDALYRRVLEAAKLPPVEVILRFEYTGGPPLLCSLDSVGASLGVSDKDGFGYELNWTDVSALGVSLPTPSPQTAAASPQG
jgi:hypothetical protein